MIPATLMPHAPILLVATSVNATLDSLAVDLTAPVWQPIINSIFRYNINYFIFLDINECAELTDMCDGNATCNDTEGSYECACNSGYSGDGFSCSS